MKLSKQLVLILVVSAILAGCAPAAQPPSSLTSTTNPVAKDVLETTIEFPIKSTDQASVELILATTTSTRDSGLLDILVPLFEAQSNQKVKLIAVGSGAALKMGEEGNADVLLVHAPKSELELMEKGFGKDRLLIMHNDFIIVGPTDDPAGLRNTATASEAFTKIADLKSTFVSRGDDSGTHKAELNIWKNKGITPEGNWYLSTGGSMGDTLRVASEKIGYTFTDRATYLALRDTLELDILVEGDKELLNIYHVITVNPEKWPLVNYTGAKAFADLLVSVEAQAAIADFGMKEFGQPLFIPDAGKVEDQLGN